MPDKNEDLRLWSRLKDGDREALDMIYQAHISSLMQYGFRFTRETVIIEDAVHDLFVYLWQHRSSISSTDSIRAYLLYALRNRLLRLLKTSKRFVREEQVHDFSVDSDNKEEELIDKETKADWSFRLRASFDILSNREREAIFLKYFNGCHYDDICRIMDINYQSARNLISRALKKLYHNLEK